jgi:hypothetical protein
LRSWEPASLLISIWFSAPLGIVIAEVARRRAARRTPAAVSVERIAAAH